MKRLLMWMVVPTVVVAGLVFAAPEKAEAWGCGGWGVGCASYYGGCCDSYYGGYYRVAYPTYGASYWAVPPRVRWYRTPTTFYRGPVSYYRGYYGPYFGGYRGWW